MKETSLLKESIWSEKVVFVGAYCRLYVFGSDIVIKRVSIICIVWSIHMKEKYVHNIQLSGVLNTMYDEENWLLGLCKLQTQ